MHADAMRGYRPSPVLVVQGVHKMLNMLTDARWRLVVVLREDMATHASVTRSHTWSLKLTHLPKVTPLVCSVAYSFCICTCLSILHALGLDFVFFVAWKC